MAARKPAVKDARAEAKERLFKFWDRSEGYFDTAHELNADLDGERRKIFSFIPRGSRVLDVACGTADNGRHLVKARGCRYTGVDISRAALKIARRFKHPKFKVTRGDVAKLDFKDGAFDAVISTYSLEHFLEPERIFSEMVRVLKKGGRLILAAPAFEFPLGVPPSVGAKARNPFWRLRYTLGKILWDFRTWADRSRAHFYLITDPSVLEDDYTPDNDLTHLVSIREMRKFFLLKGMQEVYRYSLAEKPEPWLKKTVKRVLTLLPPYRFAGVHLLVVFEK